MARTQFKVTFTNAQPGAPVSVLTPSVEHIYSTATAVQPVGGKQLYLDATNSITVWSDAQDVITQTVDGAGLFIQGTATVASPTVTVGDGTAPVNPAGSAASSVATLTDVTVGTPTYGTTLGYDPAASKWKSNSGPKFYPACQFYLPSASAFALYRAGLARARSNMGVARIHAYGDSIVNGFRCTTPYYTWSWPSILRDAMKNSGLFGTVTDGWIYFAGNDERISAVPAGWSSWTTAPGDGNGWFATNASTPWTFSPPVACDHFSVMVWTRSADTGQFRVTVDGTTNSTFVQQRVAGVQTFTVLAGTPGTPATHTFTVDPSILATGDKLFLMGVEWWSGDASANRKDVAITRAGVNGTTTTSWVDANSMLTAFDGPGSIGLCLLALGTNDINNAIPVATYKSQMRTLIQRARTNNSDVLLVAPHPSNVSNIANLSQYVTALYQLCDEENVGLFDLSSRWPAWATSQNAPYGYTASADGSHPNQPGYSDIAHGVFDCLRIIASGA